ncbi:hypothetical protein [Sulfurimonas sp.]|uniref:multiheme c-type cytochrome n=1 Tax=Sulfurimonas sp. TaxID=2022749 RepID=UPI00261D2F4E|nr:hypothetical protein [Sulfurimonas sp.]
MKKLHIKLLTVALFSYLFTGCGGGDTTNTETTPTVTTPTVMPTQANKLNTWYTPRVFAKSLANSSCNQDKVFSLRPHQNSIKARLVDFSIPGSHPTGYRLYAKQVRDPNIAFELSYDTTLKQYVKECSSVSYVDKKDIYPTYWIEAVDANNSVVTRDKVTLYDGGDQNCIACHASTSEYPLAYGSNPANNPDPEVDFKTNILRIHDQKHNTTLEQKVNNGEVVSCTSCHGINGVMLSGQKKYPSLTNALHKVHVNLSEPNLVGAQNCLTCHSGETIQKTFSGKIVHPFTDLWKDEDGHGEWVESNGAASCTLCHGMDLRGTQISNNVSCYKCHGQEWKTPQIGTTTLSAINYDPSTETQYEDDEDDEDDD